MPVPIQCKKEGKEIIDKIDKLTPWDKGELLMYVVSDVMTEDEIEKYFIEGSGYTKWDEIDYVQGVIDNNQESEVLDEMDDYDILDYILYSFDHYRNSSNLSDWIERMPVEDVTEGIDKVDKKNLDLIMDDLYENHKDKFMYILEYFNRTLAKHSV